MSRCPATDRRATFSALLGNELLVGEDPAT